MKKIITHDRVAHADETFAAAILRLVFGAVVVERTRDPTRLAMSAGAPDTFLLDVGGQYDASQRRFDHHQPEGAGFRNTTLNEWPYATAGLVWRHYGEQAVRNLHPDLDETGVKEVVQTIDDSMLKYIDAVDCGVRLKTAGPSVSSLFASFNPAWYEGDSEVFPLMLDLAQVILTNFIKRCAGKLLARNKVRGAERALDGRVLVLEACFPWSSVVAEEFPEVLFVAYPVTAGEGGQWQLRAAVHSNMSPRIKLPSAWGGLERISLANASGVNDAVFCHRSLHLAGAYSEDSVLRMAELAIAEQKVALLKAA